MAATGNRIQGRSCLIVGGTGGIGLACARRFVDEGARVVVTGFGDPDDLEMPDGVTRLVADATLGSDVARMYDEAMRALGGRLDILLHVAGISGRRFGDGPLHECSDEGWESVMAANARSVFFTNRRAAQIMLVQERDDAGLRGSIVNVGSVLAESPSPEFFGTIGYAASKGAIRSLTLSAAAKYAEQCVRFNLIEPGLIDTPMADRAIRNPAIRVYLISKQPLVAGPGLPSDVAEAALYLSEPASRFVTGAIHPVDGGWRLADGQIPRSGLDD